MIKLNDNLFLVRDDEEIQTSITFSLDVIHKQILAVWLEFMETGAATRINKGLMGRLAERDFVNRMVAEDYLRRQVHWIAEESCKKTETGFFFLGEGTVRYIGRMVERSDDVILCDYLQNTMLLSRSLFEGAYYCGFTPTIFGVPCQYVRQEGRSYYFAQLVNKKELVLPPVYGIEAGNEILLDKVQELNLMSLEASWAELKRYLKRKHKVNILYNPYGKK